MKELSQPVDKYSKLVEKFSQSVDGFLTIGNRVKMGINRLRRFLTNVNRSTEVPQPVEELLTSGYRLRNY